MIPTQASELGYTRLAFADEFDSIASIDLADSGQVGFNWYLRNEWPNCNLPAVRTYPITDPAYISVSNSILTLNSTNAPIGFTLSTALASPQIPGYSGFTFDPSVGFYFEIRLATDTSLSDGIGPPDGGWPVIWSMGTDFFTSFTQRAGEIDFCEFFPNGIETVIESMSVHDWTGDSQIQNPNNVVNLNSDISQFHTYGTRLIPAAKNGGTGLIQRYFDGAHVPQLDVTYVPDGDFSIIEAEPMVIVLGTGFDWPLQIDWIHLWQPEVSMIQLTGFPTTLTVGQTFQVTVIDGGSQPPPDPPTSSPNNTRVPPDAQIIDDQGNTWTMGSENPQDLGNYEILKNGGSTSGYGTVIVWCNSDIYVKHTTRGWWLHGIGTTWTSVSSIPCDPQ